MISAKGLAQEKHLQRVAVTCRACPSTFVFGINGVALAASRFMTTDDHAGLRTTSSACPRHLPPCSRRFWLLTWRDPQNSSTRHLAGGRHSQACGGAPTSQCRPCYVCGVWNPRNVRPCRTVECFDPLQKGWRSLRPMSVPRANAAAAVVGDHMYVCGGFGGGRRHNSVESFDTLSEVWEAQPAMAHERMDAGAAVIRERIHVVGGSAGSGVTTTYAEHFDGAWTTMPPMIHSRCLCTTAVIAEKLYVCGGRAVVPTSQWSVLAQHTTRGSCSVRRCSIVRVPRSPFYGTGCMLLPA